MTRRTPLTTIAAALALALALLVAVMLPMDNLVYAADPSFVADTDSRSIAENTPPGVNIGNPISATDTDEGTVEYGQTLTYSLGGTDAASFDIDASTGQLITKAPLNFETKNDYSVTVTVDDGETRTTACTDCTKTVTINVSDETEPPAAPIAPAVVSGPDDDDSNNGAESTTTLKVVWHEPENTAEAITGYAVQYKKTTDAAFTNATHSGTDTVATIDSLKADTSYDVRVNATNPEGTSPWSLVGTGSTNKAGNSPPNFTETLPVTRDVDENTSPGADIGKEVTAQDGDSSTLTYRLEGPDAALFAFVTSSGQIRTKSTLNHENPDCGYVPPVNSGDSTSCSYKVTVTVADGAGGSDAIAVKIVVEDESETIAAPARPTVRATEKSSTSLDVTWKEPANTGPPITGYEVRYRTGNESFSNNGVSVKGATATISGVDSQNDNVPWLTAGASYEVQVKTVIAGGNKSVWSVSGTGRTNQANREPRFDDRPSSGDDSERMSAFTTTRSVDENTRAGQPVGRAVRADDGDGDRRTFKLGSVLDSNNNPVEATKNHPGLFDIDESTGQIRTKAPLNHESGDCGYNASDNPTACTYKVAVSVWDGLDTHGVKEDSENPVVDDTITVAITVDDEDEAPDAPIVTVTSPGTTGSGNDVVASLKVEWYAPENTGPDITGYDVQYKKGSNAFEDFTHTGTDVTATIPDLDADTSYSVQVRAVNAEEKSGWSRLVTVKTNKDGNETPAFDSATVARRVDENESNEAVGDAVTHNDSDSDSSGWTYSIEGPDAALFTIDRTSAVIKTRSGLNHENPECGYKATDSSTSCTYNVRVKVVDGDGGSASTDVTITVDDVLESPTAPTTPTVRATKDSGWSLDVTWNEPRNMTGKPPITDYDIHYREFGGDDDDWVLWPHGTNDAGNTDRKATIDKIGNPGKHLDPKTQYEVRVKAKNDEGPSPWSSIGRGTTDAGNRRPEFDKDDSVVTLSVDENTRSGQNVGSAVSASDKDGNALRYTLEGPGKDLFTIVSSGNSGGQIKTKAALDYETREFYSVTVKVDDGQKKDNSDAAKSVTIQVDDVDEIPPAPPAPTVSGIPGSTDSVRVTWNAPKYAGPPITDYEVRHGEAGSGGWNPLIGRTGADRSAVITGLTAGTRYAVQVRTKSAEGVSDWSSSGTGSPNPDIANRNPTFSGGSRSFSVAENTVAGTDIGTAIGATDPDGDTLTYSLEGTDADSFNILSTGSGGQIQTSADLNHEEKSSYSVTVRVRDGRGGSNTANVTIRVTDVDGEAPDTPVAPTVTALSSTSIQVNWDAPANEGPPITDYDYRYRASGDWTEVTNTTITGTTATITGLTASTYYDVEVRAKNAEGASDWSNPGIGTTNAPGANNMPVFSDGTTATRSISASAQPNTPIGDPIRATDADSGDTLTYTLEGRDAANFDITSTTGQLLTKSGVTLIVGDTYTVTVAVSDTKDTVRIDVTINATAAPPNNPPVFSGTSRSFTVRESASAGTAIGSPVTATDADAGDTLTYTLEGTDAASFDIRTTSAGGQIVTKANVALTIGATHSVTVVATDNNAGRATIAVTITVIRGSFGCATNGAVTDSTNTGLVSDCEALLAARNTLEGTAALNWSASRPITDWEGVYVRGTPARVTWLILRNRNLDGTIPPELGRLSALTQLQLHANSLTGTIPAELGELSGLTQLNLRNNSLTGPIPNEIGNLTNLERLLLHDNSLSGDFPNLSRLSRLKRLWFSGANNRIGEGGGIPTWLNNLTSLEQISFWGNQMGGTIPNLSGLTNLELLKLQSNNLTGGVPAWFGEMSSLRLLYLQLNSLSGPIPPELGRLTGLRRLWLDRNQLTGTIPPALGNMSNLVTLNLRANQLTGSIPPQLSNLSRLQHLRLHNNQLTEIIPSQLGFLRELTQLAVSNNQLSGTIPPELGALPKLSLLWIHNNRLTEQIPSELGDLSHTLTNFKLAGNSFDADACIPSALANVRTNDYTEAGLSACTQ